MSPQSVQQMTSHVSQLLAERLGARGRSLEERLHSRVRALPRRVRAAAGLLAQAEAQAAAPKLIRQINTAELERAYQLCTAYLVPLGKGARLRDAVLSAAASVAFGMVAVVALVILVL